MLDTRTRKLTLAGIFVAAAVLGGVFSFPVLGSRCAPMQHLVNILAAVFLGPLWGVGTAFAASLLRNIAGVGTLMAFPGSMIGALLCGLIYHYTRPRRLSRRGLPHGTESRELHRLHRPLPHLHRRGEHLGLSGSEVFAAEDSAGVKIKIRDGLVSRLQEMILLHFKHKMCWHIVRLNNLHFLGRIALSYLYIRPSSGALFLQKNKKIIDKKIFA